MPMSWQDAMVLSILVCCVPLQYWISQHASVPQDQRTAEVYRILNQARTLARDWLSVKSWRNWLIGIRQKYIANDYSSWYFLDDDNALGECPAVEVWTHRNPEGLFGMSPRPRTVRPHGLRWRVGQVVKHKLWGYRGVIIGWDPKAKAPEKWIEKMHAGNEHWKEQPNYALLLHTKRGEAEITYVPQENITPVMDGDVTHPAIDQYFDYYDGGQYVPRPWLTAVYPLD